MALSFCFSAFGQSYNKRESVSYVPPNSIVAEPQNGGAVPTYDSPLFIAIDPWTMEAHLRKITRCLGKAVAQLEQASVSEKNIEEVSCAENKTNKHLGDSPAMA